MQSLLTTVQQQLYNLRLLFAGYKLTTDNTEYEELTRDLKNLEITTFATDRKNLRNDVKNVATDYKKAFTEKQLH